MDFPAPLIQSLRAAQKIVALTGAGISAESGLATFRRPDFGASSNRKSSRPRMRSAEIQN
jgi:NAD-dependent SIR2 family protein deacetylase